LRSIGASGLFRDFSSLAEFERELIAERAGAGQFAAAGSLLKPDMRVAGNVVKPAIPAPAPQDGCNHCRAMQQNGYGENQL